MKEDALSEGRRPSYVRSDRLRGEPVRSGGVWLSYVKRCGFWMSRSEGELGSWPGRSTKVVAVERPEYVEASVLARSRREPSGRVSV